MPLRIRKDSRAMKTIRLNKNGASLSETLVTVLLLGIVLSAVTTGVHAMSDSYFSIRRRADAESLLMTASDVISGDLRNVTSVDQDENGNKAYYCESRYSFINYVSNNNDEGIQVQYFNYTDGGTLTAAGNKPKPLVTDKTNADHLYTKLDSFEPVLQDGVPQYFKYKIGVYSSDLNKEITSRDIVVKPLNKVADATTDNTTQGS